MMNKLWSSTIDTHFINTKVPVFMYHSVANHDVPRPWNFLSLPIRVFDKCMRYLSNHGYNTITLDQLYRYKKYNETLPNKPVVLTFDDGFLDNWVHAYPILKKYGLKGTIFVNPDFVDPCRNLRPTLNDVWKGKIKNHELQWWGYLSWAEMRQMENEGVMDIQSHTNTHTWYFDSSKIIDFHHPGDQYFWLVWNQQPDMKYKWLTDYNENCVGYGAPVYSHKESLIVRRYFADEVLNEYLIQYVKKRGNKLFFKRNSWKNELFRVVEDYNSRFSTNGRYETEKEHRERLFNEIVMSKNTIESNLNKNVSILCWPRGKHSHIADDLAMEAGYIATTKGIQPNVYGVEPNKIHRIGPYFDRKKVPVFLFDLLAYHFFVAQLNAYCGIGAYSLLLRVGRLATKAKRRLKR